MPDETEVPLADVVQALYDAARRAERERARKKDAETTEEGGSKEEVERP